MMPATLATTTARFHVAPAAPCADCGGTRWEVRNPESQGGIRLMCGTERTAAEFADKLNERFGL